MASFMNTKAAAMQHVLNLNGVDFEPLKEKAKEIAYDKMNQADTMHKEAIDIEANAKDTRAAEMARVKAEHAKAKKTAKTKKTIAKDLAHEAAVTRAHLAALK